MEDINNIRRHRNITGSQIRSKCMLACTPCTLCINAGKQCWVGSSSAKYARCAENSCTTVQCEVIVAHSQYVGSDAVDDSPSGSSVILAAGDPPYGSSASSVVAQLPGNWAELQVGNKKTACCLLIAAATVRPAQHLSLLRLSSCLFLLASFATGELDQCVDDPTRCIDKRYKLT